MAEAAAEVGVVLLLFTIGIEFSLEKLARIQRLIFLGGGLQVGLVTAAADRPLLALGVGWRAALYTGCLVALSSTAIVLKLLADRGETDSRARPVGARPADLPGPGDGRHGAAGADAGDRLRRLGGGQSPGRWPRRG